jgi:hypothetical protein
MSTVLFLWQAASPAAERQGRISRTCNLADSKTDVTPDVPHPWERGTGSLPESSESLHGDAQYALNPAALQRMHAARSPGVCQACPQNVLHMPPKRRRPASRMQGSLSGVHGVFGPVWLEPHTEQRAAAAPGGATLR